MSAIPAMLPVVRVDVFGIPELRMLLNSISARSRCRRILDISDISHTETKIPQSKLAAFARRTLTLISNIFDRLPEGAEHPFLHFQALIAGGTRNLNPIDSSTHTSTSRSRGILNWRFSYTATPRMTLEALKIALTAAPSASSSSLADSLVTIASNVSPPLSAMTTSVFSTPVRNCLIDPAS